MTVMHCPLCDEQVSQACPEAPGVTQCPRCGARFAAASSDDDLDLAVAATGAGDVPAATPPPAPWHDVAQIDMSAQRDDSALAGDERLFEALMSGATVTVASHIAGISCRTAYRRLSDPEFRDRLEKARAVVRDSVVHRLVDASGAAIDALWNLMDHEDVYVRIRAARVLLDGLGKVHRVMQQHKDTVQHRCELRQESQDDSHRSVLTRETTKTSRGG